MTKSDDTINKQAAIYAICKEECGTGYCGTSCGDVIAIEQIPSAEPKKGRWIFARHFVWECSECGKNPTRGMGYTQRRDELFRYCPNCGAKMEVKE